MGMTEKPKEGLGSKLLSNAGGIIGGLTTVAGWLGVGEKRQDRRQLEQQGKLNDLNAKTAREQLDYENQAKLKMWKDTNYTAQLEEAKKAGVSKAAAIGGSGTGTQAGAIDSATGGAAADAASTLNANTGRAAQGLQAAATLNLMKAQADNLNADTQDTLANIPKKGIDTDVATEDWRMKNRANEAYDAAGGVSEAADTLRAANQKIRTENEKAFNDYEAYKAAGFKGFNNNDPESPVAKAIRAGLESAMTQAENLKKDGSLKDKANAIEGFKARLADQGISPDTPWYAKLIIDMATKMGMSPIKWLTGGK